MIHDWFDWVAQKLIFKPLYKLYTLVWWHNHSESHICTSLSPGTSSTFWDAHETECQLMIHTQFQVVYTVVNCGLWFLFLHQSYLLFWQWCVVAQSQKRVLRDAIRGALQEFAANRPTLQLINSENKTTIKD